MKSEAISNQPSRRQFLKRTGQFAVAAASGALADRFGRYVVSDPEADHKREYTSGDTIETIIGDFKIDDWTIKGNSKVVLDFLKRNPKSQVRIEVVEPTWTQEATILQTGTMEISNSRLPKDSASLFFHVLPKANKPSLLRIMQEVEGKIVYDRSYTVQPKTYLPANPPKGLELYSEIPLEQSQLAEVSRVQQDFSAITTAPIWIHKAAKDNASFVHETQENHVVIGTERFKDRKSTEGALFAAHELAHSIVNGVRHDKDQTTHMKIFEWYFV